MDAAAKNLIISLTFRMKNCSNIFDTLILAEELESSQRPMRY